MVVPETVDHRDESLRLRWGGGFHAFMQGPDGGTSDNPGCFLDVVPHIPIVFTSALVAGWRPGTQLAPNAVSGSGRPARTQSNVARITLSVAKPAHAASPTFMRLMPTTREAFAIEAAMLRPPAVVSTICRRAAPVCTWAIVPS